MMHALLVVATCCFLQNPPGSDLLQSVERQRGGRHWIDQPTDPPKTAEESAACMEIEPGYRIRLVACEPVVIDPVAIDFDFRGRMIVAEYSDYPVGPADSAAPPLSKLVVLQDTDADGRMDHRTVFADQLRFCHSLMAFQDGVLACTDTQILYLADTNDDNVADRREIWFDGFIPAHPQMQIGCPRYGFDNWIYLTYGHGKVRCLRPGFESRDAVEIPGMDFRFHPETMQFEAVSGAGQFGNTIDNFGHRFFSSNRNPIMTDVLTPEQVRRNPLAGITIGHTDVGPSGEHTRVYPRVAMKSNWLSHAGTHTSACGVTAYRGGLFGADSSSSVFVCEPVGHLVTRSILQSDGAGLTARRAREQADFLTSTDTWFRPTSLATGPDGALYLADMYRLWVEHPKFVPDDVAAKMNWRAGDDLGRIWRVEPESGLSSPVFDPPRDSSDLLSLLNDGNGWRRMLGQRLIVERRLIELEPELRRMLTAQPQPSLPADDAAQFSRLHALWTLDGLHRLTAEDLQSAMRDPFSAVRRDAARLIAGKFPSNSELTERVSDLCLDPEPAVRLQALLAVDPQSPAARTRILESVPAAFSDTWLQRGILIVAGNFAADVATVLIRHAADNDTEWTPAALAFLQRLALNAAASGNSGQLTALIRLIAAGNDADLAWQTACVNGLADGLPGNSSGSVPRSLTALLQSPPAELSEPLMAVAGILQNAARISVDRNRPDPERVAAMNLMTHLPPKTLADTLSAILTHGESAVCQRAAIEAARRSGSAELAALLLEHWDGIHPLSRSVAVDFLLLRPDSARHLLEQMESERIPASVISIDQRLLLLQNPDQPLRSLAAKLFGGTVSANRRQVADQYAAALDLPGDPVRGAQVFEKTCSKCHRVGNSGYHVGPDISDTRARARDALLYDVLDPNRRVDPQYAESLIVTTDGRSFAGLMVAETGSAVTLRQPEGRTVEISRSEIEELRSSSKSLMPEGIEKDVDVQQMADLLTFLKDR